MTIIRRIGPDPHENGKPSRSASGCPDILELDNGDFVIIGEDVTEIASRCLPPTAGCGPDERIIRIPRETLVNARKDIPAHA